MPTPHPPDPAFAALQLSDSFFPSGMYATSSGLEAIFYEGGRAKLEALRGRLPALLETYISNQLGPVDCVLLSNAYDFALRSDLPGLLDLDRMAHCLRPVKEIREASARSGSQLLRCVSAFGNGGFLDEYYQAVKRDEASGTYPISLAIACYSLGLTKESACQVLLYSAAVSIVGSALRLGVLDHLEGQRLLHELSPCVQRAVQRYSATPLSGLWQFDPEIQLYQVRHERMKSKMFIT
jgi:urease accessory protein